MFNDLYKKATDVNELLIQINDYVVEKSNLFLNNEFAARWSKYIILINWLSGIEGSLTFDFI